ncbi:MAG: alanine--tRNA ligase [Gemmatimonadetes bacterium]|nr:alanine--tRNA ligase [Gemmatimonadota bacterium]
MKAAEIRKRFLEYFRRHDHRVLPSSSLVPADDPTLLFTNAGMVQFKRVFLGLEPAPHRRSATAQKCVRAGGKHNDLEQVGQTSRHHTFFEMLGNFSFGDYFKREAIVFAWELLTEDLGFEPDRLWATVHHADLEAASLWREVAGLPAGRIFGLGDKDNFWQMAETGPCGPCSELVYDLRPRGQRGALALDEFVALTEAGALIELWNLVFMQYERDASGALHPLPAPSIDTGAGLERLAAVLQEVDSNYHTDLFRPLLERISEVVGVGYDPGSARGVSFRVLADHARAVAFLLADGVFPSNEDRGYVLRRILRRAARHAWLLGRREPTLVEIVDRVVDLMGEAYPELVQRREHLLRTTRDEEERFLATLDAGMRRFDEIAPVQTGEARPLGRAPAAIAGEGAFRLYDTYGFPLDLTELMARERGYTVDVGGFERALEEQRRRSRADRAAALASVSPEEFASGWQLLDAEAEQEFVGWETTDVETEATAVWRGDGRVGLQLRQNPFYVEAGGQVSDQGWVRGEGWTLRVEDVRRVGGRVALFGPVTGEFPDRVEGPLKVRATVVAELRRDTQRNHTATHLLHAALRKVLGSHVLQRGSLVAPDRLRFDFSHPAPLMREELRRVEEEVNAAIWEDCPVCVEFRPYEEAVAEGAMALFGEKYGDVVRMVKIPGVSLELCGGTHVRHCGDIGLLRLVSESGIAAGVRRIEAVTGRGAYRRALEIEERLRDAASLLRTDTYVVGRRIAQLLEEKAELERRIEELRRAGGVPEQTLVEERLDTGGPEPTLVKAVRLRVVDEGEVRAYGDRLRALPSAVVVVDARFPDDKVSLFGFVTDDLIRRGLRADHLVRELAARTNGRGGGRAHMAQAGVGDVAKLEAELGKTPELVRRLLGNAEA